MREEMEKAHEACKDKLPEDLQDVPGPIGGVHCEPGGPPPARKESGENQGATTRARASCPGSPRRELELARTITAPAGSRRSIHPPREAGPDPGARVRSRRTSPTAASASEISV